MDFRKEELNARLTEFLMRFSPPQSIKDNTRAQQAEAELLLKVLRRYAPQEGAGPWADKVLGIVAERSKHRAWPLASEVGAVAKEFGERPALRAVSEPSFDPVQITADRMNRGEAVGDQWLYGARACELIRTGQVTETTMRQYRSALYFAEKKVVGEDEALKREAARKARHDASRNIGPKPEPVTYTPKTFGGAA